MANKVFANGREVSCKSADGKTICAFPDVCWSPPSPPAGPVPIPYPNTAFATDTTNGSKTIKISGKEVMLKDKSYFKKSTGDEPATRALGMGVITHTITGKVYFNSWSMDVKFEGENVDRHFDLTTDNHASQTGNTPPWIYCDEMAISSEEKCAKEYSNERTKCAGAEEEVKAKKLPKQSERKAIREACCADKDCQEARKCMLVPYSPELRKGQIGCCEPLTPHHVIPVHCFMPPGVRSEGGSERYLGCDGYDPDAAPCICVEGEGKDKQHGDIHEVFDNSEDSHMINGKAGSWSYEAASSAAVQSLKQVGCNNEGCTKAQLDAYHKQKPPDLPSLPEGTPLRADSKGTRTPENFVPSKTDGNVAF